MKINGYINFDPKSENYKLVVRSIHKIQQTILGSEFYMESITEIEEDVFTFDIKSGSIKFNFNFDEWPNNDQLSTFDYIVSVIETELINYSLNGIIIHSYLNKEESIICGSDFKKGATDYMVYKFGKIKEELDKMKDIGDTHNINFNLELQKFLIEYL